MSTFIETAADVERQLQAALEQLATYEDNISPQQAWERLSNESPGHPVLLMRLGFGLALLASLTATVGAFAFPFVEPMLDLQTRRGLPLAEYKAIEAAIGFPMPLSFGAIAICMGVGFAMMGLVAVTIGRDAPMLSWEAKEHAKLAEEVRRLTQQKNAIQRKSVTPAGARPRIATPAPSQRVTGPGAAPGGGGGFGGGGGGAPSGSGYGPSGTSGGGGGGGGSLVNFGGGGGGGNDSFVNFDDGGGGGSGSFVNFGDGGGRGAPANPGAWDDKPTSPHYAMPDAARPSVGGGRGSGSTPGASAEPWLQHAIDKGNKLAKSFPVQAQLQLSTEMGCPFSLKLERATPAMAVRAMMSYVEFLANIPTPPMGKVDLGVAVVDRGFYRNVRSAVEPYFPDTCELVQQKNSVELKFTQPDQRWKNYPYLP